MASQNKRVPGSSSGKQMSVERAARFLDTQEEFLESLAIRPEKIKKEYEGKGESSISSNQETLKPPKPL